MNTIKCKYCGREQEISEVLEHQLKEQVLSEVASERAIELEQAKKETEKIAREKVLSEVELTLKDNASQNEDQKKRIKDLQDEVLSRSKEKRELEDKMERLEIENEKKLDKEREIIREQAMKIAVEKSQGEVSEIKKQLDDTKKALESANYKLAQTSQQLQGEILELDLEKALQEAFIYDEIIAVSKGVQGADIIQKVKGQSGRQAGIILWETKDAKWQLSWLATLRENGRKAEATTVVLACKNPPKDIQTFQIMDGVLVTSIALAVPLAGLLRRSILQIAVAKQTADNKDEKLEFLYEYLQSEAFRHRFESFAEGIKTQQDDLESERRSMERIWKKREIEIKRMLVNASKMYGELQGVMGNVLPEIKVFSLPEKIEENE